MLYRRSSLGQSPWLKYSLIGLAFVIMTLYVLAPLAFIFVRAFSQGWANYLSVILDPYTRHAIGLTLVVALLTVPINLLFGTFLAWLVTRYEFRGRKLLMTLIDIPFAVSPIVAGLLYLLLYGSQGLIGGWLDQYDVQLMFAWPGLVLVTLFVTSPFVARELIPLMQQQGQDEEEAAISLGANGWQMFSQVTLPKIRWALLYGVVLTNARAMGEFGAVSVVSGSIRGQTNTLALHIELLAQDFNAVGAFVSASLLASLALFTLLIKALVEWRQQQQLNTSLEDSQ